MDFESQLNKFIHTDKKSLWVENLFYTSSSYSFLGVLKLWLYDTSGNSIFMKPQREPAHINNNAHDNTAGNTKNNAKLLLHNIYLTLLHKNLRNICIKISNKINLLHICKKITHYNCTILTNLFTNQFNQIITYIYTHIKP